MFSLLQDYKTIKGLTEEWFRVLLLLILAGTTLLFLAGLLMRTCDGITIQKWVISVRTCCTAGPYAAFCKGGYQRTARENHTHF